ncbi:MAG: anti-sigma factor antagonist [Candidatus Zixiibacteriota bacterium]
MAPPPPGPDRWEQTGGRGLVIIKELAHQFELLPRDGGGTLARMTFDANNNAFLTGTDAGQGLPESGKGGTEMDYREEVVNDVDIMRVSGRIDLVTSNTLKDAIRERLHRQRLTLVLNLERVDFINSSGLGALVSILKDVRLVNGRMALCNLAPYVQEIFDITQLSNVFEIFPAEKEAVRMLAAHAATVANA